MGIFAQNYKIMFGKNVEDRAFRIAALVLLLVGIGMFIGGFFVPPLGVIDGSVITAFGELLGAIGILFAWDCTARAIMKGYDTTVTHKDTTVTLSSKDKES